MMGAASSAAMQEGPTAHAMFLFDGMQGIHQRSRFKKQGLMVRRGYHRALAVPDH
jgi:hypothetical protein